MKRKVEIIGYYKRERDNGEYILFRQNNELYLTNGICLWRNCFKKIEKIYLPQLKKVHEINMEKMLDRLLHFYEYADITQKVKELSKNL